MDERYVANVVFLPVANEACVTTYKTCHRQDVCES